MVSGAWGNQTKRHDPAIEASPEDEKKDILSSPALARWKVDSDWDDMEDFADNLKAQYCWAVSPGRGKGQNLGIKEEGRYRGKTAASMGQGTWPLM